eukprot:351182-Chlamydomonas_euryale.AAC.6
MAVYKAWYKMKFSADFEAIRHCPGQRMQSMVVVWLAPALGCFQVDLQGLMQNSLPARHMVAYVPSMQVYGSFSLDPYFNSSGM